jgi:hypothetical protein
MAYTNGLDNPELYFQIKLWTGNDGLNALTFDGSENMQPDLVWLKPRTRVDNHRLMDSVRGAGKMLPSNGSGAEESLSEFVSFDTDGFTLNTSDAGYNSSSHTYVSWNWKKIATAGFDIVAYTGNGSNRTIAHSLSAVPKIMIVKTRSATSSWQVYHVSIGNTKFLELNGSTAEQTASNRWQDTTPTSSVFSIGTDAAINADGTTYINYLFAEKQGFSKFGKYTGNGNADGTFVYTGFKPAFVLQKCSSHTGSWHIHDSKRSINGTDKYLYADTNEAEVSTTRMDFLSNGFKLRSNHDVWNGSGRTNLYMAFAESPFVNSSGVPNNAR